MTCADKNPKMPPIWKVIGQYRTEPLPYLPLPPKTPRVDYGSHIKSRWNQTRQSPAPSGQEKPPPLPAKSSPYQEQRSARGGHLSSQ